MKRVWWMKQLGVSLVSVAMLAGAAWADPTGTANLPQILFPRTGPLGAGDQRTFRTTDSIFFQALYYDDNAACNGVSPNFVQLFLFNAQGKFIQQFDAGSFPDSGSLGGRLLFKSFASAASVPLAPGGYGFTFLVRDCMNTKSIVLPGIVTFSVFAP